MSKEVKIDEEEYPIELQEYGEKEGEQIEELYRQRLLLGFTSREDPAFVS